MHFACKYHKNSRINNAVEKPRIVYSVIFLAKYLMKYSTILTIIIMYKIL
jgi:hypothetical protein